MRLDKLLSLASGLSRQEAKEAIRAGRVYAEGLPALRAQDAYPEDCVISLDGQVLSYTQYRYVMFYKPIGVLTAARDARQATVMDLLPPTFGKTRVMPVGRLDKDSEGLLILCNDGELAHRMLSPGRMITKEYEVRVEGILGAEDQAAFHAGIALQDFTAKPADLIIIGTGEETSEALVRISEGKNRQVRRMFGARGHEVLALKRLAIGPLRLDPALKPGEYRELSPVELNLLQEAVGLG